MKKKAETKAKSLKFKGKPKARTIKVSWKLDKRVELPPASKERVKKETAKLSKSMRKTLLANRDCLTFAPPLTQLSCPRCGKEHKIKPKKLAQAMVFFNQPMKAGDKPTSTVTYWAMCPKTKEPILLFDRLDLGASIENVLVKGMVQEIAEEEDKLFLADIKKMASGKGSKATKQTRDAKGNVTSSITMKFMGKPQVWTYVEGKR